MSMSPGPQRKAPAWLPLLLGLLAFLAPTAARGHGAGGYGVVNSEAEWAADTAAGDPGSRQLSADEAGAGAEQDAAADADGEQDAAAPVEPGQQEAGSAGGEGGEGAGPEEEQEDGDAGDAQGAGADAGQAADAPEAEDAGEPEAQGGDAAAPADPAAPADADAPAEPVDVAGGDAEQEGAGPGAQDAGAAAPADPAAAAEPADEAASGGAPAEGAVPAAPQGAAQGAGEPAEVAAPADAGVGAAAPKDPQTAGGKAATAVATLQQQLKDSEADAAKQMSEVAELKKKLKELEELVSSKDSSIEELTDKVAGLEAEGSTKDGTIAELGKQVAAEQEKTSELSTKLSETETSLSDVQKTLQSEQEKLAELTSSHEGLTAKHQALAKEHDELQERHKRLKERYADPSVQHFLRAKAVKVYRDPGVKGAANKTYVYVVPSLLSRYTKSKVWLNETHSVLQSTLHTYVSHDQVEPWLPALSGFLVYGSVLVPLVCTVCCLTRIVCKLRPVLLFCHIDFLMTNLCAGAFALTTGRDPLAAFATHDPSVYLFFHATFALIFAIYILMLFVAYCTARSGTPEGLYRIAQTMVVLPIVMMYYFFIWTPAMVDETPKFDEMVDSIVGRDAGPMHVWIPYMLLAFLGLVLLRLEQLSWRVRNRAELQKGRTSPSDEVSITMRDVEQELAAVIGEDPEVGAKRK